MIILTGLKNIFPETTAKMPRGIHCEIDLRSKSFEYGYRQETVASCGGITYRPFNHRQFAEIVFCYHKLRTSQGITFTEVPNDGDTDHI